MSMGLMHQSIKTELVLDESVAFHLDQGSLPLPKDIET